MISHSELSESRALRARRTSSRWVIVFLAVATALTSLYSTAAIATTVPLTALLNVLAVVSAIVVWKVPGIAGRIAVGAVIACVVAVEMWLGFGALWFWILTITAATAAGRYPHPGVFVGAGCMGIWSASHVFTLVQNRNLVPELYVEAVPWLDFYLPLILLSTIMVVLSLVVAAVGVWDLAMCVDLLTVALLVAAGSHVVAAVIGFFSLALPDLLATIAPDVYTLDQGSVTILSSLFGMLGMRGKQIVTGALVPLGLGVAGIVRRMRRLGARPAPLLHHSSSKPVAVMTAVAASTPCLAMLPLSFVGGDNLLQLIAPPLIDLLGLALWVIAAVLWWAHTRDIRRNGSPGWAVPLMDVMSTLVLASTPAIIALFNMAVAFIP